MISLSQLGGQGDCPASVILRRVIMLRTMCCELFKYPVLSAFMSFSPLGLRGDVTIAAVISGYNQPILLERGAVSPVKQAFYLFVTLRHFMKELSLFAASTAQSRLAFRRRRRRRGRVRWRRRRLHCSCSRHDGRAWIYSDGGFWYQRIQEIKLRWI